MLLPCGVTRLFSISCYLFCIQKFKVIGGKLAVRLNNAQAHVSSEAAADSLIYKVLAPSEHLNIII